MGFTRSRDIGVTGLAELSGVLEKLSLDVRVDAIKKAGRKAGNIVKATAVERAPYDEGTLSESITVNTEFREGDITVNVGPGKKGYYGMFFELGTFKLAARPFMAPALEENADKVIDAFADEISKAISKATRSVKK